MSADALERTETEARASRALGRRYDTFNVDDLLVLLAELRELRARVSADSDSVPPAGA